MENPLRNRPQENYLFVEKALMIVEREENGHFSYKVILRRDIEYYKCFIYNLKSPDKIVWPLYGVY